MNERTETLLEEIRRSAQEIRNIKRTKRYNNCSNTDRAIIDQLLRDKAIKPNKFSISEKKP